MTTLVLVLVAGAAGFVAGILVGRRNPKKVETAVKVGNAVIQQVEKKL